MYSVDGSTWTESVSTKCYPYEYHIYYKVVGKGNHTDHDDGNGIESYVTIGKADAPAVTISIQQHICIVATSGNTIDLAEYLPTDCGKNSYGTPSVSGAFFADGRVGHTNQVPYQLNLLRVLEKVKCKIDDKT